MVLWVVLEVVMVKDQEVKRKRRYIGFKGFAVKSFSKTPIFCFGHNWAYKSLNWMIPIGDGA